MVEKVRRRDENACGLFFTGAVHSASSHHLVAVTSPAASAATRPVAANANALLRELVLD